MGYWTHVLGTLENQTKAISDVGWSHDRRVPWSGRMPRAICYQTRPPAQAARLEDSSRRYATPSILCDKLNPMSVVQH